MAHFAELNSSNEVLRVIVVSNDDVNANGGDQHADAETFVTTIVPHSTGGVAWKQCSYNNNFRKQYAGIGVIYDASKDKFISPKPFASLSLGEYYQKIGNKNATRKLIKFKKKSKMG